MINSPSTSLAPLLESFFVQRLLKQRNASPNTVSAYRDTFKMLLVFAKEQLKKPPSSLQLAEIDADLIVCFLNELETVRKISINSRNLRLAAIRSFFRYVAFEAPGHSAQIQRVLAIPTKKYIRPILSFMTKEEIDALLAAPDQSNWAGRRDYALLLVAITTGLRLSELTGLEWGNVVIQNTGSHILVLGKGRKERCTPLTKTTAAVMVVWKKESATKNIQVFPNARGGKLSADGLQFILSKHLLIARKKCPTLSTKHVTPHTLRHSCAMELLQAGVDRSMIALWLGHESVETTQIYLHANLALKEEILKKTRMPEGKIGRYRPDDQLLAFLTGL